MQEPSSVKQIYYYLRSLSYFTTPCANFLYNYSCPYLPYFFERIKFLFSTH